MNQGAFILNQIPKQGKSLSNFIYDYPEDVNPLAYGFRFDYLVQEQLPSQFNPTSLSPLISFG